MYFFVLIAITGVAVYRTLEPEQKSHQAGVLSIYEAKGERAMRRKVYHAVNSPARRLREGV